MMKKNQHYIYLLLIVQVIFIASCKKKSNEPEVIDNSPLYQQLGYGKKYTSLTVNPMYDTAKVSEDFITRWNTAKQNLLVNYGGRQLQSFEVRFTSETQLTVRVAYRSDTGIATAIYTYNYTMDGQGNILLTRTATNTNASNLAPYITTIISGYLETYQFKPDWIEDKFENTKGTVAAFYRTDDPDSYFYGVIK